MKERTLSNNLRHLRFIHGELTQEQLAQAVGASRQTILAIENGKFNPSVRLALLIARYFNCNVEDIISMEERNGS